MQITESTVSVGHFFHNYVFNITIIILNGHCTMHLHLKQHSGPQHCFLYSL